MVTNLIAWARVTAAPVPAEVVMGRGLVRSPVISATSPPVAVLNNLAAREPASPRARIPTEKPSPPIQATIPASTAIPEKTRVRGLSRPLLGYVRAALVRV